MRLIRRLCLMVLLSCLLALSSSAASLVVERQVYEFLTKDMGLPSSSACGILANIEHESDFNPQILGDNGTSFGLCQWHNERWTALRAFCQAKGLEYGSVEGQLQYLRYELESNYPDMLAELESMEDTPNGAYGAAYIWCIRFERPSDMENKAKSRGALARGKYWNRYHNRYMALQEQPEPTDEEVRRAVRQSEVTIPQPPQQLQSVEPEAETIDPAEGYAYLPHMIPAPQPPKRYPQAAISAAIHPGTAFACALLFAPYYDGRKPCVLPQPNWEELPEPV